MQVGKGFDMAVRLGPLALAHPLINGSGTLDIHEVAEALGDEILLDPPVSAYVPKTVTPERRRGNEPPRIVETEAGVLNSIGLPNEGMETFIRSSLPRLLELPRPLILNVGGFSIDDYALSAEKLAAALEVRPGGAWIERIGLELNISCPNVRSGCMSIGADAGETGAVVKAVRSVWPGLLVVKLTPNVTDLPVIARAAQAAGADVLSLVNTFKGMVLDRVSLTPLLGGVTGGLSGSAIKPLALRAVYEVYASVDLPLIGMGGVTSVRDAIEFMACGASVVAVGSAGFREPMLPRIIADGVRDELQRREVDLPELVGCAHGLRR